MPGSEPASSAASPLAPSSPTRKGGSTTGTRASSSRVACWMHDDARGKRPKCHPNGWHIPEHGCKVEIDRAPPRTRTLATRRMYAATVTESTSP